VLVVDRPLTAAAAENAAKTRTARLGAAMVDGCAASPRAQPRAFVPYFTVDRACARDMDVPRSRHRFDSAAAAAVFLPESYSRSITISISPPRLASAFFMAEYYGSCFMQRWRGGRPPRRLPLS
jgi:hypothetical protein